MDTTVNLTVEPHKTFFGKIIAAIGSFLGIIVNGLEKAWNDLSPRQQQSIIQGVNISQIIKTGYKNGATWIIGEIVAKTGVTSDIAEQVAIAALKDIGINEANLQAGLDKLADKLQSGLTDNNWNGLWQTLANSAAQWLSTGSLNWVTLSMGLIEFAFQHWIKAK